MKRYLVTMPITGFVTIEVEASSAKAAIEAFWDSERLPDVPTDWEYTEHVTTGNVYHGMINDVEVEEVK